jgi:hypothetical protein
MTKTGSAGRALSASAAGMGTLMMGVLNHPGYSYMSDPSDFYRKFILDLVPNNAYTSDACIVMTFLVRECYGSPKKQEF